MSCIQLTEAQKKKNIYKHTASGRSKAREFSHIMRNNRFDLTRKTVDCARFIEKWNQHSKLLASDMSNFENFGNAVAIYGDYIVVGAYQENTSPHIDNGAAYVYKKNSKGYYGDISGTTYKENYKLLASDLRGSDWFGHSIAIYDDCIVVGAYFEDTTPYINNGAAYVYKRNPDGSYGDISGSTYKENYKLLASDLSGQYYFGYSVAIYENYIVVGADNTSTSPKNGNGVAYLYKKNPDGSYGDISGSTYKENYKLLHSAFNSQDNFGSSVSIYDKYIVVGAHNKDTGAIINHGAAYVFKQNPDGSYGDISGTVYNEHYKLFASDLSGNDLFGYSVCIHNDYILVGAHNKDTGSIINHGAAYLYKKNPDGSYGELLTGTTYRENYKLLASDFNNGDLFGYSVSIYGDHILVGSYMKGTIPYTENGAAYLYKKNPDGSYGELLTGATYKENYKLMPVDTDSYDYFGISVAISNDYMVIGSYGEDSNTHVNNGAAYIYNKIKIYT